MLCASVINDGFFEAFENAGDRMITTQDYQSNYNDTYEAFLHDIHNEDKNRELEEAEKLYHEAYDFQCLADRGLEHLHLLKALDLCDAIGGNLRLYNVCRAQTNEWDPVT